MQTVTTPSSSKCGMKWQKSDCPKIQALTHLPGKALRGAESGLLFYKLTG